MHIVDLVSEKEGVFARAGRSARATRGRRRGSRGGRGGRDSGRSDHFAMFSKFSAKFRSFSAVSAAIFASKYAFSSIFQNLPDYLAEIFEILLFFSNLATFAKMLLNSHNFC